MSEERAGYKTRNERIDEEIRTAPVVTVPSCQCGKPLVGGHTAGETCMVNGCRFWGSAVHQHRRCRLCNTRWTEVYAPAATETAHPELDPAASDLLRTLVTAVERSGGVSQALDGSVALVCAPFGLARLYLEACRILGIRPVVRPMPDVQWVTDIVPAHSSEDE